MADRPDITEQQVSFAKKALTSYMNNRDVKTTEGLKNLATALKEKEITAENRNEVRDDITNIFIQTTTTLPPKSQAQKLALNMANAVGFADTVPDNLRKNIEGLIAHRPGALGSGKLNEAYQNLITKGEAVEEVKDKNSTAYKNASKDYSKALMGALEATMGMEVPNAGVKNVREDALSVLISIGAGESNLSELPIHVRNHTKEKGGSPELRGLPGVEYDDDKKAAMNAPDVKKLAEQSGVAAISGSAPMTPDSPENGYVASAAATKNQTQRTV